MPRWRYKNSAKGAAIQRLAGESMIAVQLFAAAIGDSSDTWQSQGGAPLGSRRHRVSQFELAFFVVGKC